MSGAVVSFGGPAAPDTSNARTSAHLPAATNGRTSAHLPAEHVDQFIVRHLNLLPVRELMALPPEQRMDHALIGERLGLAGRLYKGFALMGLKESLPHGEYLPALAARGMKPRTARDAVSLARLSTEVSPAAFAELSTLEPSKLDLIADWDIDDIEALCAGETVNGISLEDAQSDSVAELRGRFKKATAAEYQLRRNLTASLDREAKLQASLNRFVGAQAGTGLPPSVQAARIEGSACGLSGEHAVGRLEALARALLSGADLPPDPELRRAHLREGLAPIQAALLMLRAAADGALRDLSDTAGHYLPGADAPSFLTAEEVAAAVQHFSRQFALRDLQEPAVETVPRRGPRGKRGR